MSQREHKYMKKGRTESEKARALEGDFDISKNNGEKIIHSVFGLPSSEITKGSLIQVAKIFSTIIGEKIPRDFQRTRKLVIKWFDEHYDKLADHPVDFPAKLVDPKDARH